MPVHVGTAGWSIPRDYNHEFQSEGSSLERYTSRLSVVEINSSFHREHRVSTWERWRNSVPREFRFSVKCPKTITHQARLADCIGLLDAFLMQIRCLGEKLAVVLVQLPPTLAFDARLAATFFGQVRARTTAKVACEPRNASWFTHEADHLLEAFAVARVAADPSICAEAAIPGGWRGFSYWRLHGSPVLYRSSYGERIEKLADQLLAFTDHERDCWCIFDNTASSAAMGDALRLDLKLRERGFVQR